MKRRLSIIRYFVPFLVMFMATLLPNRLWATTVTKTLYLNRGDFVAVDTTTFPAVAFNETATYDITNARIELQVGDTLELTVINTDSLQHDFSIKGSSFAGLALPANGTANATIPFPDAGIFIYFDNTSFPKYVYLGAASMITVVDQQPDQQYFWDFHEFERDRNFAFDTMQFLQWGNYEPDYYTVNGKSYPNIDADSTAKIRGVVGDTIHIYLANTGQSVHSVHFHGYHLRILYSSKAPEEVNWQRDTAPLWPMETLLLELVPDKPGIFPVHDHNLMAVTGNRYYRNGALLFMEIQ